MIVQEVAKKFNNDFEIVAKDLESSVVQWVTEYIIQPYRAFILPEYPLKEKMCVWILTDSSTNELTYKIAYNPSSKCYGVVVVLNTGEMMYLGDYETLFDAICDI